MNYETYEHIRSYCFDDLKAYIGTPNALAALQLVSSLHGPAAAIMRDKQHGLDLYECHDLTPRERAAAHLLAVISNHRAATWWREPETPDGSDPAPPLEPQQLDDAWNQTREAVEKFAVFLPEREAELMRRMAVRPAAPAIAAPVVTPLVQAQDEWIALAQTEARKIIKRQAACDLFPSQTSIADEIADDFRKRDPPVVGAEGKPLCGASIKRHALRGISSGNNRQQSTTKHRGK